VLEGSPEGQWLIMEPWEEIFGLGEQELNADLGLPARRPAPFRRAPYRHTPKPAAFTGHPAPMLEAMHFQAGANAVTNVNRAVANEMEKRRKLAADLRKEQADKEAEERKRQHELKLEQMRIDALTKRLQVYQV
jgi:hypothetical protein